MFFKNTHFHFMGIGGIGMSGLAKILIQDGYTVSGCDSNPDKKNIEELLSLGCQVAPCHQDTICKDSTINVVVHTTSINPSHPELQHAQQQNITIVHRATILAEIMRTKFAIAVAGSHGKTTTTSLLTHCLLELNQDPTFSIGGHLNREQTNAYRGTSNLAVAEADESDRSFLKLFKTWSIVTNIDLEHLETYKDLNDIKATFQTFIQNTPFYGASIVCLDDPGVQSIISQLTVPLITYGTHHSADICISNITLNPDSSTFNLFDNKAKKSLGDFITPIPGMHNVLNSTAVITMLLTLHLSSEQIAKALATFTGVARRFTFQGISKKHQALIFDDYGHHPEELRNTFLVARKKTTGKLFVLFQPHRYTRTKHLWHDFIKVLGTPIIDHLIIADIFPASESPIEGVSSKQLAQELCAQYPDRSITYLSLDLQGSKVLQFLDQKLQPNDLILLQGAGKINQLASQIKSLL